MHHATQNFSDVTAIDTTRSLNLHIECRTHGYCISDMRINDTWSVEPGVMTMHLNLLDPITFKIKLLEFEEGVSGLEIVNFSINGLEILPRYQHLANKSTNYIDFYDEWVLEIPSPFYTWYHAVTGQGWVA